MKKSRWDYAFYFINFSIDTALLPDYCKPNTPNNCSESYPYRSFNGSCNNLEHPDWGMALTAFKRLRRPIYADGKTIFKSSLNLLLPL